MRKKVLNFMLTMAVCLSTLPLSVCAMECETGAEEFAVAVSESIVDSGEVVETGEPEVTKAPMAIAGLTYNGKYQMLVSMGEAAGGIMEYFLGNLDEDVLWSQWLPPCCRCRYLYRILQGGR